MDYAITLVAALLLGIGFVLQQQSAETAPESHFLSPRLFGDLFRKRKWLAGIVFMILGQVLAAWSIGHLALSLVEPLLTTNLLVALILAVPLSHQALGITEVVGALLLIAGVTILSLARSIEPIGESFGSFSHWPAAAGIACIAFAAVQAGRHRSGRRRATLTGLGAGLVFGIQDALTRQTLQILQHHGVSGLLHSWSAYCLVATGAVGLLLMQSAFNAGPLHSSLPTITAGEPVAGILLGIVVFGDTDLAVARKPGHARGRPRRPGRRRHPGRPRAGPEQPPQGGRRARAPAPPPRYRTAAEPVPHAWRHPSAARPARAGRRGRALARGPQRRRGVPAPGRTAARGPQRRRRVPAPGRTAARGPQRRPRVPAPGRTRRPRPATATQGSRSRANRRPRPATATRGLPSRPSNPFRPPAVTPDSLSQPNRRPVTATPNSPLPPSHPPRFRPSRPVRFPT